ncbi:8808_t:CDS:10, partial [Funneliformis mosseae]
MSQTPAWNTQQSGSAFGRTFNLPTTTTSSMPAFGTGTPFGQQKFGTGLSSSFTPASSAPRFGFGLTSASSGIGTGLTGFNPSLLGTTHGGLASEIEKTLVKLTQGGQLSANITKATKFSELTEQDQKLITDIEQFIQNQKLIMSSIESTHLPDLNDYVKEVADESRALFQKLNALKNELQTAHNLINERLKDLGGQIAIVDSGKRFYEAASQGQTGNILQLGDNVFSKYYHDLLNSFEERLRQYSTTIEEIDRHFSSLCQQGNENENKDLAALNESMRSQHQSFMAVTGKVATLHEDIENLREKYLNFRRVHFHDNSNPFEVQKEPSIDSSRGTSSDERKPAQELAKNLPVVTSAAQLNQLKPPSQIDLIKPAPQPNMFVQQSQSGLFGQTSQPGLFGQSSQPSLFNLNQPKPSTLFGQTTQSNLFNLGQTKPNLFGQQSQPSLFGQTSQPSMFGQTSQPSMFGQSSQPSLFGQSSQPSLFGQSSQPSLFGQSSQPSLFGQSSQPSLFGQSSQTSQPSLFGQPSQSSLFGQPSQSNLFGQQSTTTKP